MAPLFVALGVVLIVLVLFLIVATVSRRYIKVPPNVVAVISGRRRTMAQADGSKRSVGFREIRRSAHRLIRRASGSGGGCLDLDLTVVAEYRVPVGETRPQGLPVRR